MFCKYEHPPGNPGNNWDTSHYDRGPVFKSFFCLLISQKLRSRGRNLDKQHFQRRAGMWRKCFMWRSFLSSFEFSSSTASSTETYLFLKTHLSAPPRRWRSERTLPPCQDGNPSLQPTGCRFFLFMRNF